MIPDCGLIRVIHESSETDGASSAYGRTPLETCSGSFSSSTRSTRPDASERDISRSISSYIGCFTRYHALSRTWSKSAVANSGSFSTSPQTTSTSGVLCEITHSCTSGDWSCNHPGTHSNVSATRNSRQFTTSESRPLNVQIPKDIWILRYRPPRTPISKKWFVFGKTPVFSPLQSPPLPSLILPVEPPPAASGSCSRCPSRKLKRRRLTSTAIYVFGWFGLLWQARSRGNGWHVLLQLALRVPGAR